VVRKNPAARGSRQTRSPGRIPVVALKLSAQFIQRPKTGNLGIRIEQVLKISPVIGKHKPACCRRVKHPLINRLAKMAGCEVQVYGRPGVQTRQFRSITHKTAARHTLQVQALPSLVAKNPYAARQTGFCHTGFPIRGI